MQALTISGILEAVAERRVRNHIAGFAVVVARPATEAPLVATPMLDAFVGPYGSEVVTGDAEGLAWAGVRPGPEQIRSTWSTHADVRGVCVLEGEFYGRPGEARRVLDAVLCDRLSAIDQLNGLFSGFVATPQRVWLFVDRLGARPLYYRIQPGRLEATTNLYGFRGAADPPRVDALALNEHLVFGFPVDGKTLCEGVSLVPPATIVEWDSRAPRHRRYYRWPERLARESIPDGAERLQAALNAHVEINGDDAALALSMGKDSRAILAAFLRTGRTPPAFTFTNGPDAAVTRPMTARLGLPLTTITKDPAASGLAFHWDSAVQQGGTGGGWPYLILAAAAGLAGRPLVTGFSGDVLSGSWSGIQPWRAATPEAIADQEYVLRGVVVPPAIVATCLRPDLVVPFETVRRSWTESYRRAAEATSGDPIGTYLGHRLSHRNARRIGTIFHSMRSLCTVIHPFADRAVMDAYLLLPRHSLRGQAAHILAAMAGPVALGQWPTGGSGRLPLWVEHRCRTGLEIAKRIVRATRKRPTEPCGPHPHLEFARESELYDPAAMAAHQAQIPATAAVLLGVTAIHWACLTGAELPSAPAPLFLRGLAPKSV